MDYIKVEGIFNKLKLASKNQQILYIEGSVGMGKTAAAEYYFRRKSAMHFHAEGGFLMEMPDLDELDKEALIFDDISQMEDLRSREYVMAAIEREDRQIVLIGRARVPDWLVPLSVEYDFETANNEDLQLADTDITGLLETHKAGYLPDSDEFDAILERSYHNTLLLLNVAKHLPEEDTFIDKFIHPARQDMFRYMDHVFYNRLDRDVANALQDLCCFDTFNAGLVRMVTGEPHTEALLDRMSQVGDFLVVEPDGNYSLAPMYRDYMIWKRDLVYTQEQINEVYDRAAVYYELEDMPSDALLCYRRTGRTERMANLLNRLAEQNPCMDNSRDIREHFEALPDDATMRHAALIAGRAMLDSLMLDPESSEDWYDCLKVFADQHSVRSPEHVEAMFRLGFLDAVLPHRDKSNVLEVIQNTVESIPEARRVTLHRHLSVLQQTPSVINGTIELSDLLQTHQADLATEGFAKMLQELVVSMFGKQLTGFVDLVRAEYLYECALIDGNTLVDMANEAYLKADIVEASEMSFAATALMVRHYLDTNNLNLAESTLANFEEKAMNGKGAFLAPAIRGLRMKLDMLNGKMQTATDWLETAPTTSKLFTILDRQAYIQKAEVLITLGRYEEAFSLLGRLEIIFEQYNRRCNLIQVDTLKAILQFRRGDEAWTKTLEKVLGLAMKYGYVRMVADQGAAVKPLLDKFESEEIPAEYLAKVRELADARNLNFPNYMRATESIKEPLTEMEHKVIRLMCSELPSESICDMLHISYSGLKFHRQNIYRKFEVNNRHDAQRVAKSLGLNLPQ